MQRHNFVVIKPYNYVAILPMFFGSRHLRTLGCRRSYGYFYYQNAKADFGDTFHSNPI